MRLHASRLPKMMEALLNLIVNALDAVSDNGSVQIILTKSNEQFVVSITDDAAELHPNNCLLFFILLLPQSQTVLGLAFQLPNVLLKDMAVIYA